MKKSILSAIIAVFICLSCLVIPTFADNDTSDYIYSISDNSTTVYIYSSSFDSKFSISDGYVAVPVFYDIDNIYVCNGAAGVRDGWYLNTYDGRTRDGNTISFNGTEVVYCSQSDSNIVITAFQTSTQKKSYKTITALRGVFSISENTFSSTSNSLSDVISLNFGFLICNNGGDSQFVSSTYPSILFDSSNNLTITNTMSPDEDLNSGTSAKFICFDDYPEVAPEDFESMLSSGNTGTGSIYENSHTVKYFYQDDPSTVILGDKTKYSVYNSSYISLQIQTDSVSDTSYYMRIDRAYFNNRGSNDLLGYFIRSPCVDLIQKYAIIQPESFKRLESDSTYTYKINLSGFIPLNYLSIYNISIYSMSEGLLTSTSICYVGTDQSADPNPDNAVDVFFKKTEGKTDSTLKPDDSGLMPDLPNGSQDTSLKNYNTSYSYDITEITDTLETSVSQTTAFVNAIWGFFPAEIMVIVVAGIALLIILRILGR